MCTCLHSIVLTHSMQDRKKCLYNFLAPVTHEALFVSTGRGMEDPKNDQLIRALTRGIGVHHSGLPKGYRQSVEILFRCGHLRVVIATGGAHSGPFRHQKIGWFSSSSRNVCYGGRKSLTLNSAISGPVDILSVTDGIRVLDDLFRCLLCDTVLRSLYMHTGIWHQHALP